MSSEPIPPRADTPPGDLRTAVVRLGTVTLLGLLPVAALATMLVVGLVDGPFAGDFHHELYPESKLLLEGTNPFPDPSWNPIAQPNLIWPPLAAYLVAPLTLLPVGVADVVIVLAGLACFALALWILDVRDWRVYGAFGLWPEVVGEMRVAHLTPVLALLAALAWRNRDRRLVPGALVGLAIGIKFFVWPLVAWLAATRRYREAALAAAVAGASVLLVLPFVGLHDYVEALLNLGRAFDQDSYTVFGLLSQAGASDSLSRAATLLTGVVLLAATWRYRSFTLAIATALVISPIVWLDYFALAALPLALARPRLSWVWLLPIATWGLEGAGIGIGDVAGTVRLLVVFAIVLGVAFSAERERAREAAPSQAGSATGAQVRARLRRSPVA
jgi:hypothetical protein